MMRLVMMPTEEEVARNLLLVTAKWIKIFNFMRMHQDTECRKYTQSFLN